MHWFSSIREVNYTIRMDLLIPQIIPHASKKHLQPLAAPAQDARESRRAQGRDSLGHILHGDGSQDFVLFPARPWVDWDVDAVLCHVLKTSIAHVTAPVLAIFQITPDSGHTLY